MPCLCNAWITDSDGETWIVCPVDARVTEKAVFAASAGSDAEKRS